MSENLLKINNFSISVNLNNKKIKLVENINLNIPKGKIIGLVGESGCGKSITALSISQLNETPPLNYDSGSIEFEQKNLLALNKRELNKIRGKKIGMIFQEPMTSLNPCYTIGDQLIEVLKIHEFKTNYHQKLEKCYSILRSVGITDPQKRYKQFPHELSGGLRQRVMIAIAMICKPLLLIADEPTTALDVTVQAQILKLIKSLQKENNMSVLIITHDLGVVSEICDYVYVMYAGKIIEKGNINQIFSHPSHPYTNGLMNSIPLLNEEKKRLNTIPGMVIDPLEKFYGCYFADRCQNVKSKCYNEIPDLEKLNINHSVSCWNRI
tara:strand:- start:5 stop:976 length:972 start_codon:yes stop_codon:yes gene_type:complete